MDTTNHDAYDTYMKVRQASHGSHHSLGPSAAGSCLRQAAYKQFQVQPTKAPDTDAADLGTLMHLGWSAMIRAQYDPLERAPDVPVRTKGMPRGGEADDVDFVNKVVRDLKTTKDRVYQMWLNHGGPYEHYWDQLEVYALGLRQQYGGDWTIAVVAFNRETGAHTEWQRDADPEVGQALVQTIADRQHRLDQEHARVTFGNVSAVEAAEQVEREGKGPGRGFPCDWCEFVDICWPDVEGDVTPQAATTDPDDDLAVGQFALEYLEHKAAERKEAAAAKDARVFIEGLDRVVPDPNDPSAELVVRMVGGNPKDEPDCEAMAERLEMLGESPIMRTVLTARYPSVRRRKKK